MAEVYTSDTRRAAVEYRDRGYSPIPIKARSKEPKLKKGHPFLSRRATDDEFAGFDFRHNVGIVAGEVSGIIVLDDDDGGETLRKNGWHIPATPTVRTKRGYQYYFRCPEAGFPTFDVAGKVEVRGDGAYVVAPPSIHPNGAVYEWVISPDDAELAELPDWLTEQAALRGRRMQAEDVGETISNGSRNKVLFSIAGTLRRRGLDEASIFAALLGINETKCETPLPDDEVRKIARSAARYDAAEKLISDPPPEDGESGKPDNPLLAGRVDLGRAISHGIDPPDELEPDILLSGKIHHIFGPSESGKTFIALWLAKRRIEARQYVVAFDAENGPRTTSERLKQMGADPALISEYLIYLPFPDLSVSERDRRHFYDLLDTLKPALIIFDSWASFLSSAGFSENENAEIEHWDNALTKYAKKRGIASVILDHVPHDLDRSRGGARKKEVADVQWRVKKTKDFNRDVVGEVLLINSKDREGWLPPTVKFSVGGSFGELVCMPSAGTIEDSGATEGSLTDSERKVLDTLREEFPITGASASEWQRAAHARGITRPSFYRARKKLVSDAVRPGLRVKRVNDTYHPPDDTDPPGGDDTSENGSDKPNAPRYREVSNRYHDTPDTGRAEEVSQVSRLYKGETVIPAADTDDQAAAPSQLSGEGETTPHGGLYREEASAEMRRPNSGPRINLPLYLAGETTLEILTRSVLAAMDRPTEAWEEAASVVAEAANDPKNHPLDCSCEACA